MAILLLTEITPKSIAVHNATDVARFVVGWNLASLICNNQNLKTQNIGGFWVYYEFTFVLYKTVLSTFN